jgi:hypothetical protein
LPSGVFFFRGLHSLPTEQVAASFGEGAESFLRAGRELGGDSVEWGDACIELQVLPRIALRVVLWLGDDEFPARASMLFDRLVDEHMPLDALRCMARHVTSELVRSA